MYAQIITEIHRRPKRAEEQRFVQLGKGMLCLAKWQKNETEEAIEKHTNSVRKSLLERLKAMEPIEFEEMIAELLSSMDFESPEVTPARKDGGIDVRGTLVAGGVVRINMAVQAKRWKRNVQSRVVRELRGSLGTHDQGLIITTSTYSKRAVEEAARPNAVPLALMNGEQHVSWASNAMPHELFELLETWKSPDNME